jgi:adenylate cyclase
MGVSEALICHERVESLCQTVDRPLLRYSATVGRWRFALTNENLSDAMQLAKQIYSIAEQQNDPALLTGALNALASTAYPQGDFTAALRYATQGEEIWHSRGGVRSVEEVDSPAVSCLFHKALSQWHLGDTAPSHITMAQAVSLAKELHDMPALTNALFNSGVLSHFERNTAEASRFTSEVIELSTRYNFGFWLAIGSILFGWSQSVSGRIAEGISMIESGIRDYRANGQTLGMPYFLGIEAETLYLADRTPEALQAIEEAEVFAQSSGARCWSAELHRLRGVFLAATAAGESEVEDSFSSSIKTAEMQRSISLMKRAEATRTEYRNQIAGRLDGRFFRLPLG